MRTMLRIAFLTSPEARSSLHMRELGGLIASVRSCRWKLVDLLWEKN